MRVYGRYERCNLWPMLQTRAKNCNVGFVRADRSAFVWTDETVAKLGEAGASVHCLEDSSHWVHIDNPAGLIDIFAPTFSAMER